jgi:hypothetical protein
MSGGLLLAAAPAALAAPEVDLTQFSKTVSGVAPTGVTGVTVNLLRNGVTGPTGSAVRGQVDTFNAPVATGVTGTWSGAFTSHAFSGPNDQVEVNYLPAPSGSPAQLTIGDGNFLSTASAQDPSTGNRTAELLRFPTEQIDNGFFMTADGKTIFCNNGFFGNLCSGFSATVGSGSPQTAPPGSNSVTFPTGVTGSNGNVTVKMKDAAFDGTIVTVTAPGPLLSVQQPGTTGPYGIHPNPIPLFGQPTCSAYLVLSEVVCTNLTPGTYTLTDGSASPITLTVPAATLAPSVPVFVPREAGATVPGLAGGQQVVLSQGGVKLTTLTVDGLKVASATPLGDLLNGANTTVSGSCSTGLFLADSVPDLCTGATIPTPNSLGFSSKTVFGQLDDTSLGSTIVQLPSVPFSTPTSNESVITPFIVTALARYTDPLAQLAADNTPFPPVGPPPVVPSTASADPVLFQYAPLGGTTFTTLGNVNVAGGLALPSTVPSGAYNGRFIEADTGGNLYSFDTAFYVQGASAVNTPPVTGPPAPSCKASGKGFKIKVQLARIDAKKKAKHKKKKKSANKTVTISCTSTVSGGRVAVWLSRANKVIADGSGVVSKGKVSIKLTAKFVKGTYQLIEVIDSAGKTTEAAHTVTLK